MSPFPLSRHGPGSHLLSPECLQHPVRSFLHAVTGVVIASAQMVHGSFASSSLMAFPGPQSESQPLSWPPRVLLLLVSCSSPIFPMPTVPPSRTPDCYQIIPYPESSLSLCSCPEVTSCFKAAQLKYHVLHLGFLPFLGLKRLRSRWCISAGKWRGGCW